MATNVPLKKLIAVYQEAQSALAQGVDPSVVMKWTYENVGIANLERIEREIARREKVVGGAVRAGAQGALMGGLDELAGLGAAIVPGGQDFEGAQESMRANLDEFRGDHPYISGGAEILGGLAVPGGALAQGARRAKTIGGAALRAAGGGALLGGVSGAAGGDESRLAPALIGAGLGAGLGAVGGTVGGWLAQRNATRAGRRLSAAMEEAGGEGALRGAAARMERGGAGGEMVPADWSPRLRGELDWALRANPAVAAEVGPQLAARNQDAAQRLAGALSEPFGARPSAPAQRAGLQAAQRAAGEAYDAIPEGIIDDPVIHDMLTRPVIKKAFEEAKVLGEMAADAPLEPSVRNSIAVFRRLKSMASAAYARKDGAAGAMYQKAAEEMEGALQRAIPGFAELNMQYRAASDAIRAANLGLRWARLQDGDELRSVVRRLGPSDLQEFRKALAAGIVRDLVNTRTSRAAATQFIEGGEHIQRKLEIIFGDEKKMQRFMDRAWAEYQMRATSTVGGNSVTTATGIAQQLDPSLLAGAPRGLVDRALGAAARRVMGNRQVLQNAETAGAMRPMLTQPMGFEDWLKTVQGQSGEGAGLLWPMMAGGATVGLAQ